LYSAQLCHQIVIALTPHFIMPPETYAEKSIAHLPNVCVFVHFLSDFSSLFTSHKRVMVQKYAFE
jgi:hypothetical protein